MKPKRKKFLKGLVRKKSKKAPSTVPSDSSKQDGDDSTVYSVAFDASSKVSSVSSMLDTGKSPAGDPIHVVLLLMDPKTRRFELLQLEFDPNTAKVDDVFSQISLSATEPTLRSQNYDSLYTLGGEELKAGLELGEYIEKAGIVIAVPSSSEEKPESVTKMANPILSNPKVHAMLSSSGLDIPDLPEPVEKAPKAAPAPSPVKEIAPPPELVEDEPVVEEPTPEPEPEPEVPQTTRAAPVAAPTPAIPQPTPASPKSTNFFAIGAILAVFVHLVLKVNVHYTSPLGPGDSLASGKSRGLCGLLGLSPLHDCDVSTAVMGSDGVFTVSKGDDVVFAIAGKVCEDDDGDCEDGLAISEDGKITIGGSRVKTITKASADLKPWPFTEDVTLPKTFL